MRKTFPFEKPPHKPPQVVAAIKNEVRKYLKRERRKALPSGADFWDFDCKVGRTEGEKNLHVADLIGAIDEAQAAGWESVYLEILAKPRTRTRKPKDPAGADSED